MSGDLERVFIHGKRIFNYHSLLPTSITRAGDSGNINIILTRKNEIIFHYYAILRPIKDLISLGSDDNPLGARIWRKASNYIFFKS